jgi:two-component system nitrate/nitrite response regulator NarL
MEATIQVVIIEDHTLLREGIAAILNQEPGITVTGQGSTAEEAIYLAQALQPDLILLDMDMPVNGIAIAHVISLQSPETRFIFLTVSQGDDQPVKSLSSGGRVFILKNIVSTDLFRIIRASFSKRSGIPVSLPAGRLVEKNTSAAACPRADKKQNSLSVLEDKILEDLATGLSSQKIGEELHISRHMVNRSVDNIITKLQLHTRAQAALFSQYGWQASSQSYIAIEIGRK